MRFILLMLALIFLPAAALSDETQQQSDEPSSEDTFTVQVDTRLVIETVAVTDKEGRPIEGLTGEDFIVTEDGIQQKVDICEFQKFDDAPLPPIRPRSIGSGDIEPISTVGKRHVSADSPGKIKYRNRRLLVLYLDLMTMGEADRHRVFNAGRKFIQNRMAEPDLMAIMVFSRGVVRILMDFTDDRQRLDQAIQTLMEEESEYTPARDTAAAFGQNSGEFNLFNTDRQLAAVQTAVRMLGRLSERKLFVYFASGLRPNGKDNQAQLRATINAAVRANVTFYPVDARGLVARAPLGDATRPSPGGVGMFTGATAGTILSSFQQSQDTLFALASNTGGKATLDYNDLSLGIVNAQKSLSSYYILGYYTTHTAKDGRFRRIDIKLAAGRSARLEYRKGYYAEKEFSKFTAADKERQLEEALMLEDPITDLTIAMEVNYFKLNSAEYFVPVMIKIPGSELLMAKETGSDRTVIDFIGEVRDEYGTVYSNLRDKVSFKFRGETADTLLRSPIEFDCGFTLLPGKYIIKVLARNAETGRIGTYQTEFVVPNLMKEARRVPISSVVLSSQRVDLRRALFTAGKDKDQETNPLVKDGIKLIPSVTRVFNRKNDMLVYLQAYENSAALMEPLVAHITFFRGRTKAFETAALAVTEGMNPKSKAVPMQFRVNLQEMPPGEYNCQVSILDPAKEKAAFWQAPIMLLP